MRGLTPEEFAGLQRLLLPPEERAVRTGSAEDLLREDLVEQGRAQYTAYAAPLFLSPAHPAVIGEYAITPLGRAAIALYPLMLALQANP